MLLQHLGRPIHATGGLVQQQAPLLPHRTGEQQGREDERSRE